MSGILVKSYDAPSVCYREIYRYMGAREGQQALEKEVAECLGDLEGRLSFKVCYRFFKVEKGQDYIDLGFARSSSKSLQKLLEPCKGLLLFAATIGGYPDRMLLKYSRSSPTKALCYSAIGSERVESLCDLFEKERREELSEQGYLLTPRFSPGYGDLPLALQNEVFAALDMQKHLGVSLNDSALMWPCKSVTAIMGIEKKK